MTVQTWACGRCGAVDNSGGFCVSCGAPRPTANEPFAQSAEVTSMGVPSYQPPSFQQPIQPIQPILPQPVLQAPVLPPAAPAPMPSMPMTHQPALTPAVAPTIELLPGERVVHEASFSPHLILKHLRTRVLLTEQRVVVQSPHALFGLIPMGYACASAPLNEISQINHGHMVRSIRVAIGAAVILFGLMMAVSASSSSAGGVGALLMLVCLGIGGAIIATSRTVGIFFDTGGNHVMTAAGRGGDIPAVQATAQTVIAAIQRAHGHG